MQKSFALKVAALVAGAYSIAISACGAQGETAGGGGRYNGPTGGSGGTPAATGGTPGGAGVVGSTGGTPVGTGGTPVGSAGSFGVGGSVGSAGSFGVGGSVGAGGAPPSTCTSTASATTEAGGFFTSGTFKGYVYIYGGGAGTTFSPMNFMALAAGTAPCGCGSVAATADYSGNAAIGFNLNQASGATTMETITPGGTGISYSITSMPAGARMQIQGPMGGTDAMQRWCAPLTGPTGMIPWTSFQFECWEGGAKMAMPAGSPIAAAQILVPGTNAAAVPFDFCLTSLQQY